MRPSHITLTLNILLILIVGILIQPISAYAACEEFSAGDINSDHTVDISDAVFLLSFLFTNGQGSACPEIADVNGDSTLDISDPIYLLQFLFIDGPQPKEPCRAPEGFVPIKTPQDLQNIRNNLSANYFLCNDLDMSKLATPFEPIQTDTKIFNGVLEGNNKIIANLTIDHSREDFVGLFSTLNSAKIQNIHLNNVIILGQQCVGAIAGRASDAFISNVKVTGTVSGSNYTAGLVGDLRDSTITHSGINGAVYGGNNVGGIAGQVFNSTIGYAYSLGSVSGKESVGGLIGYMFGGKINDGREHKQITSEVLQSYAFANMEGGGGLCGYLLGDITIKDCFSRGEIGQGTGLIGAAGKGDTGTGIQVINCYSAMHGATGLVGYSGNVINPITPQDIIHSYWDIDISGSTWANGFGEPRSTEEMTTSPHSGNIYVDWNFYDEVNNPEGIWEQNSKVNDGYPTLRGVYP